MLKQINELERRRLSCIKKAAQANDINRKEAYMVMAARYGRQRMALIAAQ